MLEEIIKKAVKGGYRENLTTWDKMIIDDNGFHHCVDSTLRTNKEEIVCDPLFWKALGEECGWGQETAKTKTGKEWGEEFCLHCGISTQYQPPKESDCNHVHYPEACKSCSAKSKTWKVHALRFHEINLSESWSAAIKYLSEVTK